MSFRVILLCTGSNDDETLSVIIRDMETIEYLMKFTKILHPY